MVRSKSFQRNLFFSIGGIFLLYAICFTMYQYRREKEYKIDLLHARLQMYNYEMMQTLGMDGILSDSLFRDYTQGHFMDGMRVTLIDTYGKVLRDNDYTAVDSLPNHLERLEVQEALEKGSGYDIKRNSQATHDTYFYSATLFAGKQGKLIVRTAVPYSAELTESLKADNTYIIYTVILTIFLGIALYLNTSRISRHIGYLREFAVKAEGGEELDHELERRLPDDELGEISHTIITLYWKLRHSEEDKLRIKRQLTQNAAHELKTPASSIHGYLESILENPDLPEEKRKHFLERCYAQSERMSKLLQDMSALTKLDEMDANAPAIRAAFKPVNVGSVVADVLDDTMLQLQEKGIKPVITFPKDVIIQGDQSLIYSIFRNLVDNVIAYGTGASKLAIVCLQPVEETEANGMHAQPCCDFVVSDNGQGVDIQHLPYLFERFYRVDKGRSRKLGGTGLGLAIVKNAVGVHGGSIYATPTPGGGLTIHFTLRG